MLSRLPWSRSSAITATRTRGEGPRRAACRAPGLGPPRRVPHLAVPGSSPSNGEKSDPAGCEQSHRDGRELGWLAGSGRGEHALRGNRDDGLGLKAEVLLGRRGRRTGHGRRSGLTRHCRCRSGRRGLTRRGCRGLTRNRCCRRYGRGARSPGPSTLASEGRARHAPGNEGVWADRGVGRTRGDGGRGAPRGG